MLKCLLPALLAASFTASAATPSEIQTMIDAGKCSDALVSLQAEQTANPNKISDLMDSLFVEAGLCDGRINSNNRGYALKALAAIENRNPMLAGLNAKDFNELREKVIATGNNSSANAGTIQSSSVDSSQKSESSVSRSTVITAFVALLLIGAIALAVMVFSASDNTTKSRTNRTGYNNDPLKDSLRDELTQKANDLYQTINNKLDKARLSDNESVMRRLQAFSDTTSSMIVDLQKMQTMSELTAAKSKISNISTMVKVS
jgi:hypothetical protein